MTTNNKLPWPDVPGTEGKWVAVPREHAESYRELCKRVAKRDNFTEYAKELWEEIFEVVK